MNHHMTICAVKLTLKIVIAANQEEYEEQLSVVTLHIYFGSSAAVCIVGWRGLS